MEIPNLISLIAIAIAGFLASLAHAKQVDEGTFFELLRCFVADIMNLVPGDKPYGTKLFNALSRMVPQRFCECVLVRRHAIHGGIMEVYLTQRSQTDSAYPGQYHCPGSAIRNGEDFAAAAARVAKGEFKSGLKSYQVLAGAEYYFQEERGWGCSTPVIVHLETEPEVGKWYRVDQLPEPMVPEHRDQLIPIVHKFWENHRLYEAGVFMQAVALGQEPRICDHGYAANEKKARLAIAEALKLKDFRTAMGTEMYTEFSFHATNVACEGVYFRTKEDRVEVFLTEHPVYPGALVGLGQVARAGESREETLVRLRDKEFGFEVSFERVGDKHFPQDHRGDFTCLIYLALGEGEPRHVGAWYPAECLPENTLYSHKEMIPAALAAYKQKEVK